MTVYQNHVIDPTYFYDAIEEFSFNYDIYVNTGKTVNDLGKRVLTYEKQTIRGSLQDQGSRLHRSLDGNTTEHTYNFYCKSLYRINKNDVIAYKNNYYIVNQVTEYDEYGVRSAELSTIQLNAYRDLADYIKYLEGDKLV